MKLIFILIFLSVISCTRKDEGLVKIYDSKQTVEGTVSESPAPPAPAEVQSEPQPVVAAPAASPTSTSPVNSPVASPISEEPITNYKILDTKWFSKLKTGDVIFIHSTSGQADSIIEATGSLVTHMGMIVVKEGAYFVAEAVEPIKLTPLVQFITPSRVKSEQLAVKRLDESKLPIKITPPIETDLIQEFYKYNGKKYDSLFQWSDDKIYCSELVYKIFKKVLTIDVGSVVFTRELNMGPTVVELIKKRFNVKEGTLKFNSVYDKVMNEKIITPASMFESDYFLKTPIVDFSKNKLK